MLGGGGLPASGAAVGARRAGLCLSVVSVSGTEQQWRRPE